MDDPRKGTVAPFIKPNAAPAPIPEIETKYKLKSKGISARKQLRNAKKDRKSPISVRRLFSGLAILAVTSIAVMAVTSPETLNDITSGEILKSSETCTITEINSSIFFDTSCGKFEWDTQRQPGSPSENLVEGDAYNIESVGFRIAPAKVFPSLVTYEPAEAVSE